MYLGMQLVSIWECHVYLEIFRMAYALMYYRIHALHVCAITCMYDYHVRKGSRHSIVPVLKGLIKYCFCY